MKQRDLKQMGSFLLASAMVLTMFPTFSATVHAEENKLPTKEQFATVEELKSFNTNDKDGEINSAKVYFGNSDQQWWIAGSQQEHGLTLLAASPLATNLEFEPDRSKKIYESSWNCTYPDGEPSEVYASHYGASTIRTRLQSLETSYFTNAEQNLMNTTTIYTNDTKNNSVYSITDKLYLAYGVYVFPNYDPIYKYITVGTNGSDNNLQSLNTALRVDTRYWGKQSFWLRAPFISSVKDYNRALLASVSKAVSNNFIVKAEYALVPAFELNLSSVIFSYKGRITDNETTDLQYCTLS